MFDVKFSFLLGWMAASKSLDSNCNMLTDPSSTWQSTLVRLSLHGADLEGSWMKEFDVSDLDQSSNI